MADDYAAETGNSGAGQDSGAPPEPAAEAMPDNPDKIEQNTVTLPMDMMPPGMTPKDGDKLTFCVEGSPDENGVKGYFEVPKMADESWEDGFKKSMSARDDGNETAM